MVHPRRKISPVYLHQVRERSGKKGARRGGSLFAARRIFPRSSTSSDRGRGERTNGFLPLSIIRSLTPTRPVASPPRPRPTTPWGILAKQGRIIRGLHNGESWLQRRAAEANCQTRETAFEERAANNDASSLQMCNIALMREVQSVMAKMARGCQFCEMFYLAKFACASKCEIKAL